jgi:thiol-disulfide isomerase/thioredoxin
MRKMFAEMKTSSGHAAKLFAGLITLSFALFLQGCDFAAAPKAVSAGTKPRAATVERSVEAVRSDSISRPQGPSFTLGDFKGKVVVVDFWATFCGPCRQQTPELVELSRRHRDKGLEVVGLTIDEKKDEGLVLDFMKSMGMDYTIGYADDRFSRAFLKGTEDETGSPPIPQIFIFAKDGKLVEHLVGYSAEHGVEYLDRIVSEQLARS